MTVIGISVYVIGALLVVLWVYLTTKITSSIFSRERYILRVIAWPVIAWFLGLALYLFFLITAGLFGIAIESILEAMQ